MSFNRTVAQNAKRLWVRLKGSDLGRAYDVDPDRGLDHNCKVVMNQALKDFAEGMALYSMCRLLDDQLVVGEIDKPFFRESTDQDGVKSLWGNHIIVSKLDLP